MRIVPHASGIHLSYSTGWWELGSGRHTNPPRFCIDSDVPITPASVSGCMSTYWHSIMDSLLISGQHLAASALSGFIHCPSGGMVFLPEVIGLKGRASLGFMSLETRDCDDWLRSSSPVYNPAKYLTFIFPMDPTSPTSIAVEYASQVQAFQVCVLPVSPTVRWSNIQCSYLCGSMSKVSPLAHLMLNSCIQRHFSGRSDAFCQCSYSTWDKFVELYFTFIGVGFHHPSGRRGPTNENVQ